MATQICSLPIKCSKCGEIFDLSYDFQDMDEQSILMELLKIASLSKRKSLLCWQCRTQN